MSDTLTFVAYEYTTVKVGRELESLYKDAYRNFGWEVESYGGLAPGAPGVTIRFKRDRRIANRAMVLELQRSCDTALRTIADLERQKTTVPLTAAVGVGVVGSAFLAGSVFSLEAGHTVVSVALGVVGLLGWLGGYLTHGRVKAARSRRVAPLIDQQYDIVYETGEQAARLLG